MDNNQNIKKLHDTHGPVTLPKEREPLKSIFIKQEELMEAYKEAGRLPQWPLDLKPKDNQIFYRELLGYLEEEIVESEDALTQIWELAQNNKREEALEALVSFNEELADALHFWVELFIFVGITSENISLYYAELSKIHYLNSEIGEPLKLAMQFAENYLNKVGYLPLNNSETFVITTEVDTYYVAGRYVGTEVLDNFRKNTYMAIKYLKMARNCLKNKYWKAREYEVDLKRFHECILEGWLYWTLTLAQVNHRVAPLTQNYLLKNEINKSKITTH